MHFTLVMLSNPFILFDQNCHIATKERKKEGKTKKEKKKERKKEKNKGNKERNIAELFQHEHTKKAQQVTKTILLKFRSGVG